MNRFALVFPIFVLFTATPITSYAECESPSEYVVRVYSSERGKIEYELDSKIKDKKISVEFFGRREHVKRKNTRIVLEKPKDTIVVPESVFLPPAQLWFNFKVTDTAGCVQWALVNEVPIAAKGNLIGIDSPSPDDGQAFYMRSKP